MRLTLGASRMAYNGALATAIGACGADVPTLGAAIKRAQDRLLDAGGESGWWGGWQKVVFHVCHSKPYITLPYGLCRAINMDICRTPIRIQNEFYEFLEAGPGLQDFYHHQSASNWATPNWSGALAGYERGVVPTMVDVAPANQYLQVVATDQRDVTGNKRVLIGPCQDQNGNQIYSTDGTNQVIGFYLSLANSPASSAFIVTNIGGIQKDVTFGDVLLYQVDATTGAQVLLSRFAASETIPAYRRYYINRLPCGCWANARAQSPCITPANPTTGVAVTAMVRLESLPLVYDTDFLVIGNVNALIEECKAQRYGDMDAEKAPTMEAKCHANAIKILNQEMNKYLGRQQPAVNFAPFGTARLSYPMRAVRFG